MKHRSRLAALLGVPVLVAAACSSGSDSGSSAPKKPAAKPADANAPMKLPPFAKAMKVAFASPTTGGKVTDNAIGVKVDATGYQLSCDAAGKAVKAGTGHYHLLLDKSLVNMYCTPDATVSLQNVKPGMHELEVVPALNDHVEVMDAAQTLAFDYEPTNAAPAITDAPGAGAPTIKIVSPKAGATVTANFDVVVEVTNFHNSCDLYGKPAVAGYGHWHVNLDTATGPMMGMGTMQGMSCENVFHASTTGLRSGSTHRVLALLVDNGHAPLHPSVMDSVSVTVG